MTRASLEKSHGHHNGAAAPICHCTQAHTQTNKTHRHIHKHSSTCTHMYSHSHTRGRESEASKPRRDKEREWKHNCPPTNTTATQTPHTLATTPKRTGPLRGPRAPAEKSFSKVSAIVMYYACEVTVGLTFENVYLFANDVTALKLARSPHLCICVCVCVCE